MPTNGTIFKGRARGRIIELDDALPLPDGQSVTVIVRPESAGAGNLKRAFGSWAENAAELDQFLEQARSARNDQRPEPS